MDVVGNERGVEEDAEPLASDQEEKVEEDVENVPEDCMCLGWARREID